MAKRAVTMIPATVNKFTMTSAASDEKRRVAAYARVSTDSDEQFTSFEAQVDYYTRYVKERSDWVLVEVYADEGISGTSTKHRAGFNRMIKDALSGKIDLIVTKSISRFARNTVDTLTTVRKLKEKGIEVFFEKENIYTLDSKGELLITIMSSIAQEESRSISENVTWGQRKRFADGKVSLPYKRFLGYEKGPDGFPKIVEKEAKVVRQIYSMYMEGKAPTYIAKVLTEQGIPTPGGKTRWQSSTVESILVNEKYKGDALLQKKYTVDYLTKKQKINEGEIPQYYVSGSHDAIISPEVFDLVQYEIQRRRQMQQQYSSMNIFSGRIICGECGGIFGSKVWHSTSPEHRRTIWMCNRRYGKGNNKGTFCSTPHLYEPTIKKVFIDAFNKCIKNRKQIIDNCQIAMDALTDTVEIEKKLEDQRNESDVVSELVRRCVENNAHTTVNPDEYSEQYIEIVKRYEAAQEKIKKYSDELRERATKRDKITAYLKTLESQKVLITEFDETLWNLTVEKMVVYSKKEIVITFKDGETVQCQVT